jgi:hypothetical protein
LLQTVHQFEVFGTELVDQRLSLFAERFERLGIILLVSRFDLTTLSLVIIWTTFCASAFVGFGGGCAPPCCA